MRGTLRPNGTGSGGAMQHDWTENRMPGKANSANVKAQNTVMNDVRRLFGQNQQGGTVAIKNYAPAMAFDPKTLPLPQEEKAKPYGVQLNTLWSPR